MVHASFCKGFKARYKDLLRMIKKLVASKTSPPIRALVTAMVVSGKLSVTTSWGQYTHNTTERESIGATTTSAPVDIWPASPSPCMAAPPWSRLRWPTGSPSPWGPSPASQSWPMLSSLGTSCYSLPPGWWRTQSQSLTMRGMVSQSQAPARLLRWSMAWMTFSTPSQL